MVDTSVSIFESDASTESIDTRTESTNGNHRQVVVLGDPASNNAVAAVQATDPATNIEGLVVRDPLGTLTYGLMDVSGIRVRSIVDGTLGVENITRVRNVVDGTLSLVSMVQRVNNLVDGTISTVDTVTRVNRVMNLIDGTLSTVTGVDRVRNLVDGTISSGTLDYVTRVRNVVDGTLTTVTGVDRVRNVVDGTLTTVTGVDRVRNVIDGTLSLVSMVQRVNNVVDGTLTTVTNVTNITNTVKISASDGTIAVRFSPANPGVNVSQFGGGTTVAPNSGIPAINVYSTTSIFTVSGSTSGGTTSGVTLVAPSANYNFKVFAYSLQTTGIVSEAWRFTNGAGSETELWRPLITAVETTSTPKGANMAVQPPGFIFATGVSTTLALKSSTGSLVHYSVSFIKESA